MNITEIIARAAFIVFFASMAILLIGITGP